MKDPGNIEIKDYDYPLPAERIARYPLDERDQSKLLVFRNESLSSDTFLNLDEYLPSDSLLIFNETKVIQARLIFHKPSGARIEIFCLEPAGGENDVQIAYQQQGECIWKCLVGNAKRWKDDELMLRLSDDAESPALYARKISREDDSFIISFKWSPGKASFAEILEIFGKTPLPPYLDREAEEEDRLRYQTIFARQDGSIAAPTAGLHFTERVLEKLKKKNIQNGKVTLHVGAGTFKPVSSEFLAQHHMHSEEVIIQSDLIKKILEKKESHITLVGTTTVRSLESVYWQGVKWLISEPASPELAIDQWDPYRIEPKQLPPLDEALEKVLGTLHDFGTDELKGQTRLLIAPPYEYKIPDAIITNFHQPQSTLLLLVSAFIGDKWKEAYDYALAKDFRFLSYGDSCLFFRP